MRRLAERIEAWPWVKTAGLLGLLTFAGLMLFGAAVTVLFIFWPELQPKPEQTWLVDRAVGIFRDAQENALWLILAAFMGIVGKRFTANPEVMRAEAEVKKVKVATGQSQVLRVAERYGDES